MSKIQDALGKLRDKGNRVKQERDFGSPTGKALNGESLEQAKKTASCVLAQPELETIGHPEHSVAVDPGHLVQLGVMPQESDVEEIEQQFRRIKRPVLNIAFGATGHGVESANVVMVASALPASGKSFCSFNLAMSISRERDVGVILVDADVLKPNLSRALRLGDSPGLIDYLLDESVTLNDVIVSTDLNGIKIVPAGQRHPEATELLASRRMHRLISTLHEHFPAHVIIMDTPPLLVTNEAHVLSERVGQIVFVIEAGETSQDAVLHALEALDRDKPINAILNKARGSSIGSYGFGYRDDYSSPAYEGAGADGKD